MYYLNTTVNYPDDDKDIKSQPVGAVSDLMLLMRMIMDDEDTATSFVFTVSRV